MKIRSTSILLLVACSTEPDELLGQPGEDVRLLASLPPAERRELCTTFRRRYDQVYTELRDEACLAFAQAAVEDEMDPALRTELCLEEVRACSTDMAPCLVDGVLPTGCTARVADLQRCIDDDLQKTRTALATFTDSTCTSAPGNLDLLFSVTPSCMAFLAICPLEGG